MSTGHADRRAPRFPNQWRVGMLWAWGLAGSPLWILPGEGRACGHLVLARGCHHWGHLPAP